ncbi:MAG: hypothetical protein KAJ19_10965 [Gammaproteobacteria bacterium]|nr:hypothetical protein [Gammaproteobacteria bacterium]
MATVKEINHDSSTTLSDFYSTISNPDGAITVTPGAQLNGSTNGLDIDYDAGTNNANIRETFTAIATDEFRIRFYIDLGQGINRASGIATFFSHSIRDLGGGKAFGQLLLQFDGSANIEADLFYDQDVGARQNIGLVSITKDIHCIEYRVKRESSGSAADGEVEFFIDGVSQGSVLTVENFNIWANVDDHRIEILDTTTVTGKLFYDEFILDGDDTADLGCDLFSGYDLVLGGGQP